MSKGNWWEDEHFEYDGESYMTIYKGDRVAWDIFDETKFIGRCEHAGGDDFYVVLPDGHFLGEFYADDIIENPNEYAVMMIHEEAT